MNPTLRGFLVIALIVAVIYVLNLETALFSLIVIVRIAFFFAIAFFIYLLWRDRRAEIALWPRRAQVVFYGAALLMVVNVGARILYPTGSGLDLLAFIAVFVLCGFAMWRVWRDQHTYGY
jgi:hypothetical protein